MRTHLLFRITLVFLLNTESALADVADKQFISQIVSPSSNDKITGSIAAIQAFQAIREKNTVALITSLRSIQNPVNETIGLFTGSSEVKLRLVHVAVLAKDPSMLGLLLTHGARVNAKDSLGKTAAHYASYGAPDFGTLFALEPRTDAATAVSILELLTAHDLDLDSPDNEWKTPLHYAAIAGDALVIDCLLGLGVSLDAEDLDSHTPLQLAVRTGHLSFVPQLLRRKGSYSKASYVDYIVGIRSDVKYVISTHPLIAATTALATAIGWIARQPLVVPPKAQVDKPIAHDVPDHEPKAPPPSPINFSCRKSSPVVVAPDLAPSLPLPSTVALALKNAAASINQARRSKNDFGIQSSLRAAADALIDLHDLTDEEASDRKHLLAAIKSIAKTESVQPVVRYEAKSILEKFSPKDTHQKKRHRH